MLKYFRSTQTYKFMGFCSYLYTVFAYTTYYCSGIMGKSTGGILLFLLLFITHFIATILFIAGIIKSNKESHSVPYNVNYLADIGFIIGCFIFFVPIILFFVFALIQKFGTVI